jgi:hypothetical protein
MSVLKNTQWRKAIATSLAKRAGAMPETGTLSDAVLALWQEMAARLIPVIGLRGVDVIFRRALYLTSKDYPCLTVGGSHRTSSTLLAMLRPRVQNCETGRVAAAGSDLLENVTGLLAGMLGETLTGRLLAQVWEPGAPEPEQLP